MTTSSNLLQSEGKAGGPVKKKVTFDPNLSQTDKEGTTKTIHSSTKALSLKETADIVVKYLTPFYKDGKFASKVGYEPCFVYPLERPPGIIAIHYIRMALWEENVHIVGQCLVTLAEQ